MYLYNNIVENRYMSLYTAPPDIQTDGRPSHKYVCFVQINTECKLKPFIFTPSLTNR